MVECGFDKSVIYKEVFFGGKAYHLKKKKTDTSCSVTNSNAVDGSGKEVLT